MRPTPIPDAEIRPGGRRITLTPPDNGPAGIEVMPVDAVIQCAPEPAAHAISVRCVLEDGDLERLAAGGTIWLTFYGGMPPIAFAVRGPGEPPWGTS